MDVEIGFAAGDVYRFIEANGPSTLTQVKKGTGRDNAAICQAIGWLAREDKVVRLQKGKAIHWVIA